MTEFKLDALGLKCPMPVLKAKKVISEMKSGDTLELIADDSGAKSDIPALLNKNACKLEKLTEDEKKLIFLIRKE